MQWVQARNPTDCKCSHRHKLPANNAVANAATNAPPTRYSNTTSNTTSGASRSLSGRSTYDPATLAISPCRFLLVCWPFVFFCCCIKNFPCSLLFVSGARSVHQKNLQISFVILQVSFVRTLVSFEMHVGWCQATT